MKAAKTLALAVVLVINFHQHWSIASESLASSLGSAVRSGFIVGTTFMAAPLLSPFFIHSPRVQLPPTQEE